MATISEAEFARLCSGIYEDRESIWNHNPIGTQEETLLWMLLGCLIAYLSLSEIETPCFTGTPDAGTYREAIKFVLSGRTEAPFDIDVHLDRLMTV